LNWAAFRSFFINFEFMIVRRCVNGLK
jgi:hypothetical protein